MLHFKVQFKILLSIIKLHTNFSLSVKLAIKIKIMLEMFATLLVTATRNNAAEELVNRCHLLFLCVDANHAIFSQLLYYYDFHSHVP